MAQFTQREFLYIDDLLHLEETQIAFCADLASHCQDPQLAQLCMEMAQKGERHFNALLNHLNQAHGRSGYQSQYQTAPTTFNNPSSGFGFNQ